MAHHYVVTPRLAEQVRAAGGELYVWTVDDADKIARLEAIGVARRDHERPAIVRPRYGNAISQSPAE